MTVLNAGVVAVSLALALSACSSSGPEVGPVTSNPIVPEVAAFPFPSDFYLVADESTETGRRVELPAAALPENIPATVLEGLDGFSRMPIIATYLGGAPPTLGSSLR